MFISKDIKLDFSDLASLRKKSKELMREFNSPTGLNIQEYKPSLLKTEFLVPTNIMWRKSVDAASLLESASITDARKKIIRQALSQSERHNISYIIENPVTSFTYEKFREFYTAFNKSHGYDLLMKNNYFSDHNPDNLFLITIYSGNKELLGGRIISKMKNKISTDFRAVERTKLVKEGYDTVCEKLYYDIAVQTGGKYMGRGSEVNLRGLRNRGIGMLWNKLKYGYQPYILRKVPRIYADFTFLKEAKFDLAFFISLENKPDMNKLNDQLINLNLVCGENPDWSEIKSIKEKSLYIVKLYDRDFNLIESY